MKGLISSTVGFEVVNRSVAKSMQTWCASSLKAYLEGCVDLLEDDDFDSNINMETNDLHECKYGVGLSTVAVQQQDSWY